MARSILTRLVRTRELMSQCEAVPEELVESAGRLKRFMVLFSRHFGRKEMREHGEDFVEGLLSDLDRKSVEPIAERAGKDRRGLQRFIGQGGWDHHPLLDELCRQVGLEIGTPEGIFVLDPSTLVPIPEPRDRVRHIGVQPVAGGMASGLSASAMVFPESQASEIKNLPGIDVRIPHAGGRVHFSFTAEEVLLKKVERAKELLRHKHPAARLEDVISEALEALLDRIDPERRLRRRAKRKSKGYVVGSFPARIQSVRRTRTIPQWVRDAVWSRDGGNCAFIGSDGRRCGTRSGLEFDHITPWAMGGESGDPANVRLLCSAHNLIEARRMFGEEAIDAAAARRGRRGGAST